MTTEEKNAPTARADGSRKPFAEDAQAHFDLTQWDPEEIEVLQEVKINIWSHRGVGGDEIPRVELYAASDSTGFGASGSWDVGDMIAESFTGTVNDSDVEIAALEKLRSQIDAVIARLKQDMDEDEGSAPSGL